MNFFLAYCFYIQLDQTYTVSAAQKMDNSGTKCKHGDSSCWSWANWPHTFRLYKAPIHLETYMLFNVMLSNQNVNVLWTERILNQDEDLI